MPSGLHPAEQVTEPVHPFEHLLGREPELGGVARAAQASTSSQVTGVDTVGSGGRGASRRRPSSWPGGSGSSRSAPCRPRSSSACSRRPARGGRRSSCRARSWAPARTLSQVGRPRAARTAGAPSSRWSWLPPRPSPEDSALSSWATRQHSTMVVPGPGSRSKTMRSAGFGRSRRRPTCHSGTWNSSAARLAAQTRVGRSARTA